MFEEEFKVTLSPDEEGYIGRECPDCEKYFKVVFGTGVAGQTDCYCPYCGFTSSHQKFFTQAQIDYANSVAINHIQEEVTKELKKSEFNYPTTKGVLGIGISMTVKNNPYPILPYSEQELETKIECENCTLRYAIYGVFAFCPDCLNSNAYQIFESNLEVIKNKLQFIREDDKVMEQEILTDVLGNVVAKFDAFGRRLYIEKLSLELNKKPPISFQFLSGAREKLKKNLGIDVVDALSGDEWPILVRNFQKRHLYTHNAGVVDHNYLEKANDPSAVLGRKIQLDVNDIEQTLKAVRDIANFLRKKIRLDNTNDSGH